MRKGWDNRKYDGPSPRELEVLRHIVRGETDVQIGMALGVSDNTVRCHVTHAKKKLHAHTRTQLVLKAIKIVGEA